MTPPRNWKLHKFCLVRPGVQRSLDDNSAWRALTRNERIRYRCLSILPHFSDVAGLAGEYIVAMLDVMDYEPDWWAVYDRYIDWLGSLNDDDQCEANACWALAFNLSGAGAHYDP